MSTNLDPILNKVTNENIEINCRAISNLLTKLNNNLISLEFMDDITGYKFLFSLTKWLSIFLCNYQQYKYDPTLIMNVLNLYLKCLDIFPPSATQNLKKDFKISSLINDIGSINTELSNICDQIQHSLSRNTIEMISGKNNRNIRQSDDNGNYSYGNTFGNNFYESYNKTNNINNINVNFMNYTQPNGFRNNMNIKISNVNNTVNFNNNNNINLNKNSVQEINYVMDNSNKYNTISSNQNEIAHNNKIIKSTPLVNPSLIILHENIQGNNSMMSKTMSKISKEEMVNFNSQPQENNKKNKIDQDPTFNKVIIPQTEEQFIFDIGISLKYGDSVQIYHSFNIFYTQILNDIPIEYLLHCDEIIKSICSIMEKCDFLEFGVLCYKIIDKILSLIQKKISLELNNLNNLSNLNNFLSGNNILIITQDTSKLENFIYYILTSILISINNNLTKLAFYIPLLEKCFNLFNQLILGYNNYYEILYKILFNFNKIISNYKMKNIDIPNYFIFMLKLYINSDDNILIDLIENNEFNFEINVIEFIKNIFFTVFNSENNQVHTLCLNLLNKFESIKDDSEKINNFLIDYNNANLISKSIQMTQEMLNGNYERNLIIDNFYNVLLSLKYLNNSPNDNDYNNIFPNNSTPLIKALCDFYIENPENNFEKAVDLIIKLLIFKTGDKSEISISIYNSILDELKVKGNKIHPLFYNNKILNIFFNDLPNENYKEKILDILFTLFNDLDEININKKNNTILKQFFLLLPSFPKNFRFSSLQNKLESSLSYEELYFKYLRDLFNKSESSRKNAINFFKNSSKEDIGLNENQNENMDTIYCIQTGESEMLKTLKIINDETNIAVSNTNEFLPLLNILMSNKIDTNMKSSSLSQLILMIKNTNYKNYYLNDILSYLIKELEIDINKYDITTLGNYYYQLIKLLCIIVFIYLKEEKIQNLLNPKNTNNQLLINNLIAISLKDDTSHHLLSSFALIFINIYAFYYRNINSDNKNVLNQKNINNKEFNESLPVLKFFSNYYYINMVPTEYIENIYLNENTDSFNINNSILNFSVTKNIIDFMHYLKNPLNKASDLIDLKNSLKNLRNNDLLNVLTDITKFFEYNAIYYSEENDFNEELLNINLFFKRIIPNTPENKNINYYLIIQIFFFLLSLII